jgi:hypothetical protein
MSVRPIIDVMKEHRADMALIVTKMEDLKALYVLGYREIDTETNKPIEHGDNVVNIMSKRP